MSERQINLNIPTSSQYTLLGQRRFAPFFWTQFLGALNDNLFKTALITVLAYQALDWSTLDAGFLTNLIPGLFILPFVLFSATAGQLADKFEKSRLIRLIKLWELLIMVLAAGGWFMHSVWLLVLALVAMGVHSTLFGPVKYAYLPQQLDVQELTGGNGVVEMGTFVGILLGEIAGAVLVLHKPWGIHLVAATTLVLALLGCLAARAIPLTPASDPALRINWNPWSETLRNLRFSSHNRTVFLSLLGNSWFWFYGAILLAQFPVYARLHLHGDNSVFVLLLAVFSLGVGAGSLMCERLSGHKIEIGLVPFGAIGLSAFGLDLYFASQAFAHLQSFNALEPRGAAAVFDLWRFAAQSGSLRILCDCLLIGVAGGLYIVPLFALIQTRCDRAHLSRTIAGMNIMNALFMVAATVVAIGLLHAGLSIPQLFLVTALLNAVVTASIFALEPEFLVRFVAWLLLHSVHRLRGIDSGRIPKQGAAILVCDHVDCLDALVIGAVSARPIRFVMDRAIFERPLAASVFRGAKMIALAAGSASGGKACAEIAAALQAGDLVCIVPGAAWRGSGEVAAFKNGIAPLLGHSPAPLIPMALCGRRGGLLARSAELLVGLPIAAELATADVLHERLACLRDSWLRPADRAGAEAA
jgi:MFS family permease/1-acyl-sn-glycerol-3-phosphate acyltransferase